MKNRPLCFTSLLLTAAFSILPAAAEEKENAATVAKIHGGAVVQLGASNTEAATDLAKTGRYIIHLLDSDAKSVSKAQASLHKNAIYGVASAETLADFSHLPYTENLINLIIADSGTAKAQEIFRVLVPDGALVVTNPGALNQVNLKEAGFLNIQEVAAPSGGEKKWLVAHKPWPDNMGHWTHPRHDSNGNAVSPDTAVGEPRRIRWVAGHSGDEVEGMVSADGRNFYGSALTRDSFNGLRLWHRDLLLAEDKMDPASFVMKRINRARPIATEKYLFAVAFPTTNLVAIDAVTGEIVRTFAEVNNPKELIQHKGTVVATDKKGIYAFSTETGDILWKKLSSSPRTIVAGSDKVNYIQGEPRKGEPSEAVTVDLYSGKVIWKNRFPWLDKVKRSVLYGDQLAYEVSSFSDYDIDTGIHIINAENGDIGWEKTYAPGMNHARQARALFIGDDLWIQEGGKVDHKSRENPGKFKEVEVVSLDRKTGETKKSLAAGLGHCAPPVATVNMIFSGVVEMTNLKTGELVTNSITKSNCSRENGFIPANGLIYATPKHCTCWPMLRGYVAMAPEHPHKKEGSYFPDLPVEEIKFSLIKESDAPKAVSNKASAGDWPMYRNDATRSSSSAGSSGPKESNILWSAKIAPDKSPLAASSPLLFDWNDNPFVKGPISPPTIANGLAYVARPDAHEVVAIDTANGKIAWRFTARGRVDTPPTIHNGLAIFGDHAGYVHALRADNGKAVWRFQAAPIDERMGAYGQIESAWPVAGSVLVMDNKAYFAAGRQQLSDGGVFVFSLDAMTGEKQWVHKINDIPQKGYDGTNDKSFDFYKNSGLEFDPVDLLHKEGDHIALSRWMISKDGKTVNVDTWNGFAKVSNGEGTVFVPRGTWTYGFRQVHRFGGEAHRRSLTSWKNNTVVGSYDSTTALFRKDFNEESLKNFNQKWITGWQASQEGRNMNKGVKDAPRPFRSDRVAKDANWKVNPWAASDSAEDLLKLTHIKEKSRQLENKIYGIVIDKDNHTYVIHKNGDLKILNTEDGSVISSHKVPAPMWDGLALAQGKLFLSTADGQLLCIGDGAKVADAR